MNLICIICPRGCRLQIDDNNNVSGNYCKRGIDYAINEKTNPTRIITSTVVVENGVVKRLPVVTSKPIPKDKIFAVMKEINKARVKAPIKLRDIIIKDILDLGVDIIATRSINEVK